MSVAATSVAAADADSPVILLRLMITTAVAADADFIVAHAIAHASSIANDNVVIAAA